jgi:hypothetical protein
MIIRGWEREKGGERRGSVLALMSYKYIKR